MTASTEKKQFVRDWILRTAPITPSDIKMRIAQAESIWQTMGELGYGDESAAMPLVPQPQAEAETRDFEKAPDPLPGAAPAVQNYKPAPSQKELLQDEAHWRGLVTRHPHNQQIRDICNAVREKLGMSPLLPPQAVESSGQEDQAGK